MPGECPGDDPAGTAGPPSGTAERTKGKALVDTQYYIRFERATDAVTTPRGLRAALHGEALEVDVVRDDVVRIRISRGGTFDESPTFALCVDPLSQDVEHTVEIDDDVARVRTSALVVSVWLDPFRIDVHRTDGSAVVESVVDDEGRSWAYAVLNDAFHVRRRARREDAVFGLGEKAGRHNRKGRSFTLWNTDVLDPQASGEFAATDADDPRSDNTSVEFDPYYMSIPFFYHQAARTGAMAASFVDNGYRAGYDFSEGTEYSMTFEGGQYCEYVFAGPDMPDILEAYTWLTGRAAPPPLWALGFHQCRWFDYSQDDLEALAARLRERGIPCDVLWLDIDHMDGYRVFTWNTDQFPDAPGMLEHLREQGFGVITIVDPGVKHEPGYAVFDQAVERDVLCRTESGSVYVGQVWPGITAFPDFVEPEARAWWGELNADHVRSGLAGIWNDMNEPATGAIPAEAMRFGRGQFPHERYHNQYALLMAMGTTEGLLEAMPDKRTFVLSRAGSPGIQRYAANWMGDNMSRWEHLWMSIPMGAGLGISGQPFAGADVGGFGEDSSAELLARWTQYGALTPFFRNHAMAGTVDQYAWSFGEAVEDLVRDAIALRYRLMPYLYAAFLRASETGAPVQRPLVYDFQYDAAVRDIDDQYLFGPDLLVAPVVAAGTTARQVYLPEGTWYDWHTGERLAGPRFVTAATPMDRIPLFARGGAVVPMWSEAPPTTAGYRPDVVELHLFVPGADGTRTSFLQEDDGLTFAAADGARYRTELEVTRAGGRVRLDARVDGDGFAEFAREAFRVVLHGAAPASVLVDGVETQVRDGRVVVPNAGTPFTLELEV
ncbi:TIM-barrel domain-containing protein [Georgenia faecalis]|uniref:TIM-barrel domain-containing protein n=1 Tax=Georgenia faecalis TaxID=2483799 RepID=A0ABV9D9B9_9MICO|nr:TIM-barrel domain-containing protein [Georgenia faecalis]